MCETVIIPGKYLNSSCTEFYEEVNVETWNQATEVLKFSPAHLMHLSLGGA